MDNDVTILDFSMDAEQDWGMDLLNKALVHYRDDQRF